MGWAKNTAIDVTLDLRNAQDIPRVCLIITYLFVRLYIVEYPDRGQSRTLSK